MGTLAKLMHISVAGYRLLTKHIFSHTCISFQKDILTALKVKGKWIRAALLGVLNHEGEGGIGRLPN